VFDWTVQRPSKAQLAVGVDGRRRRPSTVGHDARVQSSDPDEKKEAPAPATRTQSHTGACEERRISHADPIVQVTQASIDKPAEPAAKRHLPILNLPPTTTSYPYNGFQPSSLVDNQVFKTTRSLPCLSVVQSPVPRDGACDSGAAPSFTNDPDLSPARSPSEASGMDKHRKARRVQWEGNTTPGGGDLWAIGPQCRSPQELPCSNVDQPEQADRLMVEVGGGSRLVKADSSSMEHKNPSLTRGTIADTKDKALSTVPVKTGKSNNKNGVKKQVTLSDLPMAALASPPRFPEASQAAMEAAPLYKQSASEVTQFSPFCVPLRTTPKVGVVDDGGVEVVRATKVCCPILIRLPIRRRLNQ